MGERRKSSAKKVRVERKAKLGKRGYLVGVFRRREVFSRQRGGIQEAKGVLIKKRRKKKEERRKKNSSLVHMPLFISSPYFICLLKFMLVLFFIFH